ncbi:response regulator [Mucilaginibacter sp. BT774]|uniref:hybrid sensor histidine kinase/response regulator transcription factor n=1 Tax=Mucilaginibacter sp. BT774 TaxID=3062276 RepID=UPI0026745573|nr:response regulator [Mucilaginibacter sp. BT774]MDO3627617.1 response regulator [Mucilaginibacter sp. BT774]
MKLGRLLFRRFHFAILQLLLFVAVTYVTSIPAFAQSQSAPYKIKYLTVDEGLSHTDANDIAQDKQGFIWIGTNFGLDRYDGYKVRKYYNSNEPLNNAYKNRVVCLYPDNEGNIWLSTEGGLQRFDMRTERYIDYKAQKNPIPNFDKLLKPVGNLIYGRTGNKIRRYAIRGDSIKERALNLPPNVDFTDIIDGPDGKLYLASSKDLWRLNQTGKFERLIIEGLPENNINRVFFNHDHNLLISSSNQLLLTAPEHNIHGGRLRIVKEYVCPNNASVQNVLQDNGLNYWVNDGSGILKLDSNFNLIQTIDTHHGLNSNWLAKIFMDRSACLWVCTSGGGVNYFDLNEKPFYTLQHNPEITNTLSGNYVRSVIASGDDIWVGTSANGLNRYNIKSHTWEYYNANNSRVRLRSNAINALIFDNDHNLWIGSSLGIEVLNAGGGGLIKPKGLHNFPARDIDAFAKDCFGNIWFGNHANGFGVIWKDDANYCHVKYYDEGFFIFADQKKPELFVASTHGLKRLTIDRNGNVTPVFTWRASKKANALSSNYTYPIAKGNDTTYWIGTIGGGLNRLSFGKNGSYTIKTYAGKYGIFNDVESLEIDNSGNIWMGGNGLECFNPKTLKLTRYDKNDGLQGNSFKVGSSYKAPGGALFFGGINGLNFFYPDQISSNAIPARPVITDIIINNQQHRPGTNDSVGNSIHEAISYCNQIKIDYRQNNFILFFSSMHFANPLKCKYRYKLVGLDKDWRYTDGTNPSAAYSNLDYNSYNFIVQATNNDGIWGKSEARLNIIITPPWWKSFIAKCFYVLMALSVLSGIYIYQARWYKLKRDIEVRKLNDIRKEEIHRKHEELYQQQLTFFTNISHEFRTPLTLILGPLENLIKENKDAGLANSYQVMLRNAKRLINLISDLMNFKKVADSIIKLQVKPLNVRQFCNGLVADFENIAISKDIDFKFIDNTSSTIGALTGYFDPQVLEKILFNLLNNSFKYTGANGKVTFELFFDLEEFTPSYENGLRLLNTDYDSKRNIFFRVADSGIGISEESITKIFDRYYRVSKDHLGSGVGLALVKSLTQLHKGSIYVYSERNKGTEIIIGIPWAEDSYNEAEKVRDGSEAEQQLEMVDNSILQPLQQNEDTPADLDAKKQKHILIVEDNQELRLFLRKIFEKNYLISEAKDGNEGLKAAVEKAPDLIISDVMMPNMTGIEFCKLVKEKFETRHIPFIILSAKDALDAKIEGMESGADFYFAKPLSIELLLLTAHNIFEQREALKLRYANNYLASATELVQSEKDQEFFKRLIELIENNIQATELDVDFLCRHLYLSRTKLYQKIKSISDQSVGEFIRTTRLKKSIHIMTHEDISMGEVADRVGLQSTSNFSRVFKKEYGKSPLQFMQAIRNQAKPIA